MDLAQSLEPPVPPEEIAAGEPAKTEAEKVEAPKEEEKTEPEKLVRLEALHEERQKRKALQREVEEQKRNQAILNERLNQILQSQQPRPQEPDPNDPIAVHDHKLAQTERELAGLRERQQREDWAAYQRQQKQQLANWYLGNAAEYVKTAPDFMQAYEHMKTKRLAEFTAMGYSQPQAMAALEQDELWVASNAYQSGQNPADIIYKMALANGYTKKDAKAAEKKMEALQSGVKASKALGTGGADSGKPTAEQIANMSDEEFAELKAALAKKGQRISDVL